MVLTDVATQGWTGETSALVTGHTSKSTGRTQIRLVAGGTHSSFSAAGGYDTLAVEAPADPADDALTSCRQIMLS